MSESHPLPNLWSPSIALRRMGEDVELLSSMVDYFLEDSPILLQQLSQLIEAGDASEASRVAHSLKGLCSNFEANAATEAAAAVETACSAGKLQEASALVPPLSEHFRRLSPTLTMWQSENTQASGQ